MLKAALLKLVDFLLSRKVGHEVHEQKVVVIGDIIIINNNDK